jgi:methylthioribulose-1-phosphate dehydratase
MSTNNLKTQLAETIRQYNSKGWSPATSTNYSFMDKQGTIWVSRSGVDKSEFHPDDFITVNSDGLPIGEYEGIKPSAETLIHCALYELFPETKVILHSHSLYPVLISKVSKDFISYENYEIQKGFEGQFTHENKIEIPVFDNSQDMLKLNAIIKQNVARINTHCFILRGHGTYAWGRNLFEAKRHLETLEYLCQYEWMTR